LAHTATIVVLGLAGSTALRATARLVLETASSVKLLLTSSENKLFAAITAS
jgi:hypothetical protein